MESGRLPSLSVWKAIPNVHYTTDRLGGERKSVTPEKGGVIFWEPKWGVIFWGQKWGGDFLGIKVILRYGTTK